MIFNVSTDPIPAIRPATCRQYDREIEGPAREGGGGRVKEANDCMYRDSGGEPPIPRPGMGVGDYDSKDSIADVNFIAGLLVGSFVTALVAIFWVLMKSA